MHFLKIVIFILGIWSIENAFAQTSCETKYDAGSITEKQSLRRFNAYTKCWTIKVPAERNAIIEVTKFTLDRTPYTDVYLKIGAHTLKPPQLKKFETRLMKDDTVTFHAENVRNAYLITTTFELNYKVQSLACDLPNAFKCNETECIPESQRCNGNRDCANGADETDCPDVGGPGDLSESREKALELLYEKQSIFGGWGEKTPEAVSAIHLATGSNFNANCEEKLMAKALELQIATKTDPTLIDRSNFINALLAICGDPDDFYGKKFVTDLETAVFPATPPTTGVDTGKGLAYLALCNAESTALQGKISEVQNLLAANSDNDMKYFGILTIACLKRQVLTAAQNETLESAEKDARTAMNSLMRGQLRDGSFSNNVALTAKIVQAWKAIDMTGRGPVLQNYQKAITYLQSEIEKSPRDYDSLLSSLPVFGGRSLADIKCNNLHNPGLRKFTLTKVKELTQKY